MRFPAFSNAGFDLMGEMGALRSSLVAYRRDILVNPDHYGPDYNRRAEGFLVWGMISTEGI